MRARLLSLYCIALLSSGLPVHGVVPAADGRTLLTSRLWMPPEVGSDSTFATAEASDADGGSGKPGLSSNREQMTGEPGLAEAETEMNGLLMGEPRIHGAVRKAGMLPEDRWSPAVSAGPLLRAKFDDWLWNQTLGTDAGDIRILPLGDSPPLSAPCTVLFSPLYKFIFIKNTKTAGTSLFLKFGGFCPEGISLESARKRQPCLWRTSDMVKAGLKTLGYRSWQELWSDYTVFTLARNPYDRAGSAYDYLLARRKSDAGTCRSPTFASFCARPYALGMQDTVFGCNEPIHDFYHVEPQFRCLTDDAGQPVMDFVIRVANIAEDFKSLTELINAKRERGLPAMDATVGWAQKGPLTDESEVSEGDKAAAPLSRHLGKFQACGSKCLQMVDAYYARDFQLFGYRAAT